MDWNKHRFFLLTQQIRGSVCLGGGGRGLDPSVREGGVSEVERRFLVADVRRCRGTFHFSLVLIDCKNNGLAQLLLHRCVSVGAHAPVSGGGGEGVFPSPEGASGPGISACSDS